MVLGTAFLLCLLLPLLLLLLAPARAEPGAGAEPTRSWPHYHGPERFVTGLDSSSWDFGLNMDHGSAL